MMVSIISFGVVYFYFKYFDPEGFAKHSDSYWVLLWIALSMVDIGREVVKIRKKIK